MGKKYYLFWRLFEWFITKNGICVDSIKNKLLEMGIDIHVFYVIKKVNNK